MSNNTIKNGKGDKPRPTKKSVYDKNYDEINWNSYIWKSK